MRGLWSYKMIYKRVNTGRCVTSALTGARMFPGRRQRRVRARGGSGGGGGGGSEGNFSHFCILIAGSLSPPPTRSPKAEFRWAGSFSPPTQVAQAEFRWLLAAGYW
jgi:hypothetical protein